MASRPARNNHPRKEAVDAPVPDDRAVLVKSVGACMGVIPLLRLSSDDATENVRLPRINYGGWVRHQTIRRPGMDDSFDIHRLVALGVGGTENLSHARVGVFVQEQGTPPSR